MYQQIKQWIIESVETCKGALFKNTQKHNIEEWIVKLIILDIEVGGI